MGAAKSCIRSNESPEVYFPSPRQSYISVMASVPSLYANEEDVCSNLFEREHSEIIEQIGRTFNDGEDIVTGAAKSCIRSNESPEVYFPTEPDSNVRYTSRQSYLNVMASVPRLYASDEDLSIFFCEREHSEIIEQIDWTFNDGEDIVIATTATTDSGCETEANARRSECEFQVGESNSMMSLSNTETEDCCDQDEGSPEQAESLNFKSEQDSCSENGLLSENRRTEQAETQGFKSEEYLDYTDGLFRENRETCKNAVAPYLFNTSLRTSSSEDSIQLHLSSEETVTLNECTVTAGESGLNFRCTTFMLRGSVPEGAIPAGQNIALCIRKHDQERFQLDVEGAHFASDVYECEPHGMKFQKQILLQFPCHGESSGTSQRTRRAVIYSPTARGEAPSWMPIQSNHDTTVIITGDTVSLFISRFCLFSVVEYPLQQMYVDMLIYGTFYKQACAVKLSVVLANDQGDICKPEVRFGQPLQHGNLLAKQPLSLVQDVDMLELILELQSPDCWDISGPSRKPVSIQSLWKDKPVTWTFLIKLRSTANPGPCPLFCATLYARHADQMSECCVVASVDEMLLKGHGVLVEEQEAGASQLTMMIRPPNQTGEQARHTSDSSQRSESMLPKEIARIQSAKQQSSEDRWHSDMHLVNGAVKCKKLENCVVKKMKLPDSVKAEIAKILDVDGSNGTNWKDLAKALGYDEICGGFYTGKTKHLFALWEAAEGEEGTVDVFAAALEKIGHKDLGQLIKERT